MLCVYVCVGVAWVSVCGVCVGYMYIWCLSMIAEGSANCF